MDKTLVATLASAGFFETKATAAAVMGRLGRKHANTLAICCYDGCTTYTRDKCTKWHPVSLDGKQLVLAKRFSNDNEPTVFGVSEQDFSLTFHRWILLIFLSIPQLATRALL